jgi:hypothetical protein
MLTTQHSVTAEVGTNFVVGRGVRLVDVFILRAKCYGVLEGTFRLGRFCLVRFEVSTAMTMKNAVFWDVTLCATWRNIPEDAILRFYLSCVRMTVAQFQV